MRWSSTEKEDSAKDDKGGVGSAERTLQRKTKEE